MAKSHDRQARESAGFKLRSLGLFDFLEHFEHAFRSVDEQALEGLAQTTALEGVTACTFCF